MPKELLTISGTFEQGIVHVSCDGPDEKEALTAIERNISKDLDDKIRIPSGSRKARKPEILYRISGFLLFAIYL